MPAQVSSNSQQQWSTTGNDDPLPFDRQPGLHERLQTTRAHHIRQGPTGKRQKTLTRTGGKNQICITQFANAARSFSQQRSRRGLLKHASAVDELNINATNFFKPRLRFRRGRFRLFTTPNLAARRRIIIDNYDVQPTLCCAISCSQPCWSSSNNDASQT